MQILAVFDLSTFIWDKVHFEANKPEYYALMGNLSNLYSGILENCIDVSLRGELISEIQTYFPYDVIPNEYFSFQVLTLNFLSSAKVVSHEGLNVDTIKSTPELNKSHFNATTKDEVRYVITNLYNDRTKSYKFLSYAVFWNKAKNLILQDGDSLEIDTFLCDDEKEHQTIILSLKKIFEHNPKHDDYKSSERSFYGNVISPLSCYNERIGDTKEAQRLLDTSVFYQNGYFNKDNSNNYVKFVSTRINIYHGFNVIPSDSDKLELEKIIPQK